jgi:hypothetical protein
MLCFEETGRALLAKSEVKGARQQFERAVSEGYRDARIDLANLLVERIRTPDPRITNSWIRRTSNIDQRSAMAQCCLCRGDAGKLCLCRYKSSHSNQVFRHRY